MKAIILAEHSRVDLSPLTERIPHPLLPVAGKSILMHALELLHRGSVRRVEVVSPTRHKALAAAVDTGPLLGMEVSFAPDIKGITQSETHCLVMGLTHLPDVNLNEELARLGDLKVHALMPIRMTVCAQPVALLLPPHPNMNISSDWGDIHRTEAIQLPIGPKRLLATDSFANYQQANFHLVRGKFHHLKPAGREYVSGHRAAPKARVRSKSMRSHHGYFGSNCRVEKTASLDGHVVIGDRVVVGKGARIMDSIILDRTYVGVNTDISRAIVDRNLLIKVDTGVTMKIEDPVLLGATA